MTGETPPLVKSEKEKDTPLASKAVVLPVNPNEAIVIVRFKGTVPPLWSVTVTVTGKLPPAVGVPLIVPLELSVTPAGNDPVVSA